MLVRAVDGLITSGVVDRIVIMAPIEMIDAARQLLTAHAPAVGSIPVDAARALTPPSLIARVVAELSAGRPAVVPGIAVADTIKSVTAAGDVSGTPDRAGLRAIQTPQGFDAELLRAAYAVDLPATDDAGLVEAFGATVRVIPGDPLAFKITDQLDLRLAHALVTESVTGENAAPVQAVHR